MIFVRGLTKKPAAASGGPSSARASAAGRRDADAPAAAAAAAAPAHPHHEAPLFLLTSQSNERMFVTVRVREWVVQALAKACSRRSAAAIEAGIMAASGGSSSAYYKHFVIASSVMHREAEDERLARLPDWSLAYVTCVHDRSDVSHKLLEDVLRTKAEMERDARGSWICRAPGCSGRNCTFVIVQTRSADEGSTVYTKCVTCGNISYVG
jgi:DNA-directed RNA polymerase subunit M/transcription elongation factor TFIIS